MKRRQARISEADGCAVLVRKRVVNTYSRACPRRAIEKHHFLTPDTPVVEELELPSHLLRDSVSGSTSTTALSGAPLSCNLEPVSMELTCSTQPDPTTTKSVDQSSIGKKLDFLRKTLANELSKLSSFSAHHQSQDEHTVTVSPPLLHTPSHHYHQHTLTQKSTTSTTSHRSCQNTKSLRDNSRTRKKSKVDEKTLINVGGKGGGIDQRREGNNDSRSVNESCRSEEPDSVQLVSCDNSRETEAVNSPGRGEAARKDEGCDVGLKDGGGNSGDSESDVEVRRGVAEIDEDPVTNFCSPLTIAESGNSPFIISPDLPEPSGGSGSSGVKRKKCGVDLSGLCELSSIDGSLSQGKKHSTTNTSPTTTRWPSGGAKRLKTRTKRKQSSPKFAARLEGVSPSKRGNRKRRRKRIEPITSSPLCLTPTAPLTAATDLEERVNDGPSSVELRRSRSLEQHFNQLQITPIPPPPTIPTPKSSAPLTSTPVSQHSLSKESGASTSTKNNRVSKSLTHTLSPSLFTHHISTHQPLTSTPILPDHAHLHPNHTHNLADLLEREEAKIQQKRNVRGKASFIVHNLTSLVDSSMERLMDFDAIPYEASSVLDFSTLRPPTTVTATHSKSKTILTRTWQNRAKRARQTSRAKANITTGACTTQGPKSATLSGDCISGTTQGPKSATVGQIRSCGTTTQLTKSPVKAIVDKTNIQTKPSKTKRPKLQPNTQRERSVLKADHTNKQSHTIRKTSKAPAKKNRRQLIIPLSLRHRRTTKKPNQIHQKSTTDKQTRPLETNLTAAIHRQCILTQHRHKPSSKMLSLTPGARVWQQSNSSTATEDILTRALVTLNG